MIYTLITSQTRVKVLRRFFLNDNSVGHLRGLESEFGDSSNAIRIELNRLEKAGYLTSSRVGNKKIFYANKEHPLYRDIQNIFIKESCLDKIIGSISSEYEGVEALYLKGGWSNVFGQGVELIVRTNKPDKLIADKIIKKAEQISGIKINYCFTDSDNNIIEKYLDHQDSFLIWTRCKESINK